MKIKEVNDRIIELCQSLKNNKTEIFKEEKKGKSQLEKNNLLKAFDEKWRLKFFQMKQDYYLQRKTLIQNINN
jgi:hypothetical protein